MRIVGVIKEKGKILHYSCMVGQQLAPLPPLFESHRHNVQKGFVLFFYFYFLLFTAPQTPSTH